MKIFTIRLFSCSLLVVFASLSYAQKASTITIETLLNDMIDRDAVARFPQSDFRLKQSSSYNRASVTPDEPKGWFTNKDYNKAVNDTNFMRVEENNGKKEWVLMEHDGPGALVRYWSPFLTDNTPKSDIILRFYFDGHTTPDLEGNMLSMLDGTGLIPYPFAHQSLRSAVSFFPIPYAKSCKITATSMPFFYQFTYREYPKSTAVKTFTMADFKAAKNLTEKVGKALINPSNNVKGKAVSLNTSLKAKEEKSIALPKGNAAVQLLTVKLGNYQNPIVTRSVVLKMEFDGQQTVWCPIGDFFGTGIGYHPYQGWNLTVADDGLMSCRWTMPYQTSGKITLINLSDTAVNVQLNATVGNWKWDAHSLYFNAAFKGQYPVPTRPFSDWNYVTLKGRGVYVGDALTIMNPQPKWWGEGDEKIWIDNDTFPSIFGTGTEDYYAYSWGGISTDFYEHPFHAQPRSNVYNKLNRKTIERERNTMGYSTETRTRVLDVMPFSSKLQLDMEVWSVTDCNMGYGVGVMWYGDKQTTSNRIPDPKAALNIPPLPADFPAKK